LAVTTPAATVNHLLTRTVSAISTQLNAFSLIQPFSTSWKNELLSDNIQGGSGYFPSRS
jgi:hypothetical protein